jgi:hypothetical protein
MIYTHITKPFPDFKWRWASFTPSEGLNEPRVHMGVLRAMRDHEGEMGSSPAFLTALQKVEDDLSPFTDSNIDLVRATSRNLLRNSQQYWSGLDLLEKTSPGIKLTEFGRNVANGDVTREEFAAATVRTLSLPNLRIENLRVIEQWEKAGLKVRPLELILSIIVALGEVNPVCAYLSNEELIRVVIPLSSVEASISEHVEHLLTFRAGAGNFDSYDDFAPAANDKRMSREFLLFLKYHGFLRVLNEDASNLQQQFYADARAQGAIRELLSLPIKDDIPAHVAEELTESAEMGMLQRERRLASVLARPGQAKFRREVLSRSGNKCLLTGETLSVVLRACHIIPVELGGSDAVGNGLCLREDLHILFDSGHLRLDEDGGVHLSEHASASCSYSALPTAISFPPHINRNCVAHRWAYIT